MIGMESVRGGWLTCCLKLAPEASLACGPGIANHWPVRLLFTVCCKDRISLLNMGYWDRNKRRVGMPSHWVKTWLFPTSREVSCTPGLLDQHWIALVHFNIFFLTCVSFFLCFSFLKSCWTKKRLILEHSVFSSQFPHCVTIQKLLNFFGLQFPHL